MSHILGLSRSSCVAALRQAGADREALLVGLFDVRNTPRKLVRSGQWSGCRGATGPARGRWKYAGQVCALGFAQMHKSKPHATPKGRGRAIPRTSGCGPKRAASSKEGDLLTLLLLVLVGARWAACSRAREVVALR